MITGGEVGIGDNKERRSQALRKPAEKRVSTRKLRVPTPVGGDIEKVIHELEVHQAELERQNEELRRAQVKLQETHHRYIDLYDFAPVGFLTLDKHNLILEANFTAAELLGTEKPRLIGSRFTHFIAPQSRESYYLHRRTALKTQTRQKCELQMLKAEEKPFKAELQSLPLGDSDQLRLALMDITRRQADETERNRLTEKRRILMNLSTQIVAEKSEGGLFSKVAGAARTLAGSRIAVSGRGHLNGQFTLDGVSSVEDYTPCLSGRESRFDRGGVYMELGQSGESIRLTRKQLQSHPSWWGLPEGHLPLRGLLAARLFDIEGKSNGLIMVTDKSAGEFTEEDEVFLNQLAVITSLALQHIEARNNAERQTAKLEAVNKELEAFSYSASHDLRAPLRVIDGFSQALLEDSADKLDAPGKDLLRRIHQSVEKMSALIEGMLSLSQIVRQDVLLKMVNLSEIVQEITTDLKESQPERIAEFTIAPGIEAYGDARLLRIVLENLLNNAWKFTSKVKKTRMEFGAVQREGKLAYFVRDNGAGFDMAYAGKLFTPFQRLHSSTDFAGTGIGLATVQRIIHRHGGLAWAEGEPGKGAIFYFTLK